MSQHVHDHSMEPLRRSGLALAITSCALLCACGGQPPATQQLAGSAVASGAAAVPPMAQAGSDEFHHDDPCSLLTVAEVEAALGARLGTPPYRGSISNPVPDGSDCVYLTTNFQSVTLEVEFDGGQQAYHIGDFVGNIMKGANPGAISDKGKRAMVSEAGSEIAGEWDEAKLTPMNCCIFNALRADQMLSIDFTGSTMTLKQAASLVDAAFKRIDKPLALDGGANVAAAKAFLKSRPRPVDPCSLLTQAEVEAIIGRLAAPPKADGDQCSYHLPQIPGQIPRIYDLQFDWRGGDYQFRSDLHVAGIAGAAIGGMTFKAPAQVQVPAPSASASGAPSSARTRETSEEITVDEASRRMTGETFSQAMHMAGAADASTPGPWERSATVGPNFEAVRKDVLVKSSVIGVDRDRVRALVAAAMKKF